MDYGIVRITIPQSPIVYLWIATKREFYRYQGTTLNYLKAGEFPNVIFQKAFNNSSIKQVDVLYIPANDTYHEARVRLCEFITNEYRLKATPFKAALCIANLGMIYDIPATVTIDDVSVFTNSAYKYITSGESGCDVDHSVIHISPCYPTDRNHDRPPQDQLGARDDRFDRNFLDRDGERTFIHYEPITQDDRIYITVCGHANQITDQSPLVIDGLNYPTVNAAALAHDLPVRTAYMNAATAKSTPVQWSFKQPPAMETGMYSACFIKHTVDPGFYLMITNNPPMALRHVLGLVSGKKGDGVPLHLVKLKRMIERSGVDGVGYSIIKQSNAVDVTSVIGDMLYRYQHDTRLLNKVDIPFSQVITDCTVNVN